MNKDGIIKFLRILVLLSIIATSILYISSFISHCASSGSSSTSYYPWELPLPIADDVGCAIDLPYNFKKSIIDDVADGIIGSDNGYPYRNLNPNALLMNEYDATNHTVKFTVLYGVITCTYLNFLPSPPASNFNLCQISANGGYGWYTYDLDDSTIYFVNKSSSNSNFVVGGSLGFFPIETSLPNNTIRLEVPRNVNIYNYPLYVTGDTISYNDTVVFTVKTSEGGSSDSSVVDDIKDGIEDSSELPQVDDNPPADPSSNPSWLQKILSALKSMNSNLRGIGVTIGKYIKDLGDMLKDKLDSIIDKIEYWISNVKEMLDDIKEYLKPTTPQEVEDEWKSGFQNWDLYPAIIGMKGLGTTFIGAFDVTPADTLIFHIPMPTFSIPSANRTGSASQVSLFGNEITLDFSWYAQELYFGQSPRDIVAGVVVPWIIINLALGLYFKAPAIIGGQSNFAGHIQDQVDIARGVPGTYGGLFGNKTVISKKGGVL